jgi:hypothetical protein
MMQDGATYHARCQRTDDQQSALMHAIVIDERDIASAP